MVFLMTMLLENAKILSLTARKEIKWSKALV